MFLEDISESERISLDGVLVIPERRPNIGGVDSYLIQGGDEVLEYLLSTMDDDVAAHFRHLGNKVLAIVDDLLVSTMENNVFPLCGNCYCYINKASITGAVIKGGDAGELCLADISFASIVKDDGAILRLLPDLLGKRAEE